LLAGCARGGLDALEAEHSRLIEGGASVASTVPLDRCRQPQEPDARRWDYVLALREGSRGLAVEVHHAAASKVEVLIAKRAWAVELLRRECPALHVEAWCWVASPETGAILFTRHHPLARKLAEAGITFPVRRLRLP
jgi:hypothetical protein